MSEYIIGGGIGALIMIAVYELGMIPALYYGWRRPLTKETEQ